MSHPRPPVTVDNSLLRDVAECDTRAVLRHVHGLTSREERAELRAGSAVHELFAAFFETGNVRIALGIFDAAYREWALAHVPANHRLSWANTSRVVTEWLARHPIDGLPFTVLTLGGKPAVEIGFTLALADDVTICGRLDALGRMKHDGKIAVIENKSTQNINEWWIGDFLMDSQLSGYISGAIEHVGDANIELALVNAIEFKWLPNSDRVCKEHRVKYAECGAFHAKFEMIPRTRTPAMLASWRFTAIGLARHFAWLRQAYPRLDDLHRVPQQGLFSKACKFCPFRDFCANDRPLDLVESMLVEERWAPWEGIMSEAAAP